MFWAIQLAVAGAHIPSCAGFTAIVDKEMTKKYDKLVADASTLVKTLPWGTSFEVDVRFSAGLTSWRKLINFIQTFRKPDFTGIMAISQSLKTMTDYLRRSAPGPQFRNRR